METPYQINVMEERRKLSIILDEAQAKDRYLTLRELAEKLYGSGGEELQSRVASL
jgi:hypothetical protein